MLVKIHPDTQIDLVGIGIGSELFVQAQNRIARGHFNGGKKRHGRCEKCYRNRQVYRYVHPTIRATSRQKQSRHTLGLLHRRAFRVIVPRLCALPAVRSNDSASLPLHVPHAAFLSRSLLVTLRFPHVLFLCFRRPMG